MTTGRAETGTTIDLAEIAIEMKTTTDLTDIETGVVKRTQMTKETGGRRTTAKTARSQKKDKSSTRKAKKSQTKAKRTKLKNTLGPDRPGLEKALRRQARDDRRKSRL